MWTYIELGIGITSGNLPLLRPLFGRFFSSASSRNTSTPYASPGGTKTYGAASKNYALSRVTERGEGFQRMDGKDDLESVGDGSEIELNVKSKGSSNAEVASSGHLTVSEGGFGGEGINVRTDVDLRIEEVRMEIERETKKVQARR
jgi:hypothetical protein